MKKFLCLIVLLGGLCPSVFADEFIGNASYTGSSDFTRLETGLRWQFGLNWSAGLEAKYADEDVFKKPVYAVKMPLEFSNDIFSAWIAPFYYFKNKEDNRDYQAFGISSQLIMTLQDDSVNELYSHAYLRASFARQRGTRVFDTGSEEHNYYSQAAYTLGLHKNFYRAFSFEIAGNVFQYPDGISHITAWKGILDQQDLAPLQSFDIVHDLPKYAASSRVTWMWPDRRATFYLGYRFAEIYTADPEHSAVIGNTFALTPSILCELAYNHLQTVHNKNKRDIFYAQLKFKF